MNLLELAEPIFQYVCRLNRLARRSGTAAKGDTSFFSKPATPAAAAAPARSAALDYGVVRAEVKALLEDFVSRTGNDVRLATQARKMELPMIFFVDSMISESNLSFAQQWNQNRLAFERSELAGDEKFFDLLEDTLKENNEDASERLGLFYMCIGLGFTGIYFRQPEYLRSMMQRIAPRIRHLVEAERAARICPESYEGIDTRNLVQPPSSRMVLVTMIFLCFTLATAATYVLLYVKASKELRASLSDVVRQDINPSK
jgi:type VI protein secretion system component VasF